MSDYLVACTAGSTISQISNKSAAARPALPGLSSLSLDVDDPILDLNGAEEQDLPFVTVATTGPVDPKVAVCVTETRMNHKRLEEMLAVGIDGCKMVRKILDEAIRAHGRTLLEDT